MSDDNGTNNSSISEQYGGRYVPLSHILFQKTKTFRNSIYCVLYKRGDEVRLSPITFHLIAMFRISKSAEAQYAPPRPKKHPKSTGGRHWPPVVSGGHWWTLPDSIWHCPSLGAPTSTGTRRPITIVSHLPLHDHCTIGGLSSTNSITSLSISAVEWVENSNGIFHSPTLSVIQDATIQQIISHQDPLASCGNRWLGGHEFQWKPVDWWNPAGAEQNPLDSTGTIMLGTGGRHQPMPTNADQPVASSAYITADRTILT
ncbi:hypothetical protein DFH08DRAFT_823994 [Mycena albidolilacea]|uniref:Uncharacterized protein n=1 Tax=Mycena albidolilacea TaxID=1033008 RepID=A0AAD7EBI1_9AGAR|nr:hypothetical protein DFH08DRAFT_823994 [Mycena albidolilacea]